MSRLKTEPAWSFLLGKELQQLTVGQLQSCLRFNGETQISIECQFTVTPRSRWRWWPRRGDPTKAGSASALLCLVGQVIVAAQDIGLGGLEIVFSRGQTLRLYDSNGPWSESYAVSWGQSRLAVPQTTENPAGFFPEGYWGQCNEHGLPINIATGRCETLLTNQPGVVPGDLMSPFLPSSSFPGSL